MLTKEVLTPELQIERWEDRRDIKNLMGRYAYDCLIKNEKGIYEAHWSKRDDVCLMFSNGTYAGAEAVQGYYAALDRYNTERARLYKKLMPEKTASFSDQELYGIGSYHGANLSTPCIVVADDGFTAQAIYWCHDVYDAMCEAGNTAMWALGLLFIDLVYENDAWKLWHLRHAYEVEGSHGQPFGTGIKLPGEPIPEISQWLTEVRDWFPKPNNTTVSHQGYGIERDAINLLQPPKPYSHWDPAQTYGI